MHANIVHIAITASVIVEVTLSVCFKMSHDIAVDSLHFVCRQHKWLYGDHVEVLKQGTCQADSSTQSPSRKHLIVEPHYATSECHQHSVAGSCVPNMT